MRTLWFTLVGLFLSLGLQAQDEPAIKTAFENFKTAALAQNGAAVAHSVDAPSIAHFDSLLTIILKADSTALNALAMKDLIPILQMKLLAGPDTVRGMDGKQFLGFVASQQLIKTGAFEYADLGTIKIEGNQATAAYVFQEQELPVNFEFTKASDQWKFSLVKLMETGIYQSSTMIPQQSDQKDQDQYLTDVLYYTTGLWPNMAELWQPIIKKDEE
ncbi:MAG: hypothetical protein AAF598_16025 [Bacteroidota bacterium]